MGRTAARTGLRRCKKLFGNGSEGRAHDGEVGCVGGFVSSAEGPGSDQPRGVFGVDW